jgi:hypothetical protein
MVFVRAARRQTFLSLAALSVFAAGFAAPVAARDNRNSSEEAAERPHGQAVLTVVSLGDQRVTVYDADGPIMHGPISSGATPNDTPVGVFSILQKNRDHYSNRYDDAAMPFMQRITWTGVALHGGALPGYPASHGCVRLRNDFARELFDKTKLGMRVVVSRNNMAPVPISHPLLFKPAPFRDNVAVLSPAALTVPTAAPEPYLSGPNDPPELATRRAALKALANEKRAEAEQLGDKVKAAQREAKQKARESSSATRALRNAERAHKRATDGLAYSERMLDRAKSEKSKKRAETNKEKAAERLAKAAEKLDEVKKANQPALDALAEAEDALKAAEAEKNEVDEAARAAERKLAPVSVFVSRATQKLYVRQNYEPVFETDITIRDADRPIGTHTFTAVEYQPGAREMRWNVVSIAGRQPGEPVKSSNMNRLKRSQSPDPIPTDAAAAADALDRIEIPQETIDRIAELGVQPGSSLIVSDEAAHKETGKATDFIVLISGEPDGGIILRPKPKPEMYDDYWGDSYSYNDDRRRKRRGGAPYGPFGGPFNWW